LPHSSQHQGQWVCFSCTTGSAGPACCAAGVSEVTGNLCETSHPSIIHTSISCASTHHFFQRVLWCSAGLCIVVCAWL
jgi:hypothetical protein